MRRSFNCLRLTSLGQWRCCGVAGVQLNCLPIFDFFRSRARMCFCISSHYLNRLATINFFALTLPTVAGNASRSNLAPAIKDQFISAAINLRRTISRSWQRATPHPATFNHGSAMTAVALPITVLAFQIRVVFATQSMFCSHLNSTM